MSAGGLPLAASIPVLRARVRGGNITCAGVTLTPLRHPVLVLCKVLANSDLRDCAIEVSFGGARPSLLVGSFRDTARWRPGPRWRYA